MAEGAVVNEEGRCAFVANGSTLPGVSVAEAEGAAGEDNRGCSGGAGGINGSAFTPTGVTVERAIVDVKVAAFSKSE